MHQIRLVRLALSLLMFASALGFVSENAEAQSNSYVSTVGITVSAVINAKPEVSAVVSKALDAALTETLNVKVLSGDAAIAKLPEAARSEECLGNSNCLVSAGKALGVDQLLILIIVGIGDNLKIEVTWVDIRTGKTSLRSGITSENTDSALREAFKAHAQDLLPGTLLRSAQSHKAVAKTKTSAKVLQNRSTDASATHTTRNRILLYGGGATVGAWLAYGVIRRLECGQFGACESDHPTLDIAADVLGVAGSIALSAGIYFHLSKRGDDKPPPRQLPVALSLSPRSVGLILGGSF